MMKISYDLDIEPEEKEILSFDDQENIPKDVELEERKLFDFIEYNYLKKTKRAAKFAKTFFRHVHIVVTFCFSFH